MKGVREQAKQKSCGRFPGTGTCKGRGPKAGPRKIVSLAGVSYGGECAVTEVRGQVV